MRILISRICFLRHLAIHTEEAILKCSICCKSFESEESLAQHSIIHEEVGNGSSDFKSEYFKSSHGINTNTESYADESKSEFQHQYSFENAQIIYADDVSVDLSCTKDSTCENLGTSNKQTQTDFENSETSEHSILTPLDVETGKEENINCNVSVRDQISSPLNVDSLACEFCPLVFKLQSTLKRHRRSHTGEKPYACKFCSKNFSLKANLQCHERNHSGVNFFSCDVCRKKFVSKYYLKLHKRIHSGETPYTCKYCPSQFKFSRSVRIHELSHTGVKPYSCDVCLQEFILKSTLRSHKLKHTGGKPYSCKACSMTFDAPSALKRHQGTNAFNDSQTCVVCFEKFENRCLLRIHRRSLTCLKSVS